MADTLFVDATSTVPGTPLVASWHNDVNTATYDRLTGVAGTNTITATGPSSMTAYAAGQNFYLVPANTNSGAVTLNVSSLGAKAVTKYGTTPLVAGDMVAGTMYEVSYDGTQFQLINPGTFNTSQTVPATSGGTGQTSYAVGDLLYANTTTTLAKLPDVAVGNVLRSGGVNTAPAWGQVNLTTDVTNVLPVANGGTGDSGTAWASTSVGAITSTAGTITSANGTRRSKTLGKTVFFSVVVQIVNNGTGATGLSVANAVPVAPAADVIVIGRETQATGNLVQFTLQAGSTTASIFSATNTYPGANGVTFKFNGCYESV